ncbi:MAG: 1-acyl-sn-glycerol-3-phosphate acyltransferase [Lachnospiraceae bacterium]|nr:1-acyl-sn-glycerol-3-phosphate acyltransferase [Lachnospiraceae bacterium]
MFRSASIIIFLTFFFAATPFLRFFLWLYTVFFKSEKAKYQKDLISLRIVQWAFKVITFLAGVQLTVVGEENVPTDEPVLFIGNHRSYFDIILSYARCRGLTGYVSKKEIEKVPLLHGWMVDLYCLFLDREDPKQGLKTVLQAIEQVKNGVSVAIYPEGTRYDKGVKSQPEGYDEPLLPFHEGSFKIALKSGCPIVPMTICHSSEIFEDHLPWIRKTKVTLVYGKPVDTKSLTKEQQKQLAGTIRQDMIETYKKYL